MSDLKHLLKTNRELLRVLDEQLAVLERVSPEYSEVFSERQAYIYLSTYTPGDTEARIQIDQDSTYVAEKLIIIEKSRVIIEREQISGLLALFGIDNLLPFITFSVVDENSGRELTISKDGKNPVSSGAVPTFSIPFLATNLAISGGADTPHPGQAEWWFQFRDEFVLPRGSVLRIRSSLPETSLSPENFGFDVALVGYKVFG